MARPAASAFRKFATLLPVHGAAPVGIESPFTSILVPAGILSSDSNITAPPGDPGTATVPALCNGVPCANAGNPINSNIGRNSAPTSPSPLIGRSPGGHVDFAGLVRFLDVNDGRYISRKYIGYGGHFSGDVKPGCFGYSKDDFLFSFVAGEAIGNYESGGWSNAVPLATN